MQQLSSRWGVENAVVPTTRNQSGSDGKDGSRGKRLASALYPSQPVYEAMIPRWSPSASVTTSTSLNPRSSAKRARRSA